VVREGVTQITFSTHDIPYPEWILYRRYKLPIGMAIGMKNILLPIVEE